MRMGWEVPNPITALNPDNSVRFPFAVILPDPNQTNTTITFTVNDDGSSPIENATVICAGQEKKTNASGVATFKVPVPVYDDAQIPANEKGVKYTYFVGAEKKQPKMGKLTVTKDGGAVNETVQLLGE